MANTRQVLKPYMGYSITKINGYRYYANGGKTMSELLKSVESCSKIISIKKQRKGWGMSETLFADLFRKDSLY